MPNSTIAVPTATIVVIAMEKPATSTSIMILPSFAIISKITPNTSPKVFITSCNIFVASTPSPIAPSIPKADLIAFISGCNAFTMLSNA